MLNLHLDGIRSKEALLATAEKLHELARGFEIQARILDDKRNYAPIGKHDMKPLARALNHIKMLPKYPNLSASECRKICDKFSLDYSPAADILMRTQTILRRERMAERNQAIVKLSRSKMKNKAIAARFKLSESQISEIIRSGAR